MHLLVVSVYVVLYAGGPQIALVKKVDVELIRDVLDVNKAPHSDVELAPLVQQGPLDVLLHHPLGIWGLLSDVGGDVPYLGEQLDASPLVQSCWFHYPLVIFAVLFGHAL